MPMEKKLVRTMEEIDEIKGKLAELQKTFETVGTLSIKEMGDLQSYKKRLETLSNQATRLRRQQVTSSSEYGEPLKIKIDANTWFLNESGLFSGKFSSSQAEVTVIKMDKLNFHNFGHFTTNKKVEFYFFDQGKEPSFWTSRPTLIDFNKEEEYQKYKFWLGDDHPDTLVTQLCYLQDVYSKDYYFPAADYAKFLKGQLKALFTNSSSPLHTVSDYVMFPGTIFTATSGYYCIPTLDVTENENTIAFLAERISNDKRDEYPQGEAAKRNVFILLSKD